LRDTTLYRSSLDGSNLEKMLELDGFQGSSAPHTTVAVDIRTEDVYWCYSDPDAEEFGVRKSRGDGTEVERFDAFDGQGIACIGVEVDTVEDRLYINDGWGPHNFGSAALDGSDFRWEDHHTWVQGFATDPSHEKIYWISPQVSSTHSGAIFCSDLDGTEVQELTSIQDPPTGIALDPVHDRLYWSTAFEIWRADIGSGQFMNLVDVRRVSSTNLGDLDHVQLDGTSGHIYWTNGKGIGRLNRDGQNETIIVDGLGERIDDLAIDPDDDFIYWSLTLNSGNGAIMRSRLDGSEIQSPVVLPGTTGGPLAVDETHHRLFWVDRDGLYAAELDGSNRARILAEGAATYPKITEIVVDPPRDGLYWAFPSDHVVGWMRSDGSELERFAFDSEDWWGAMAIDLDGRNVYWWSKNGYDPLTGTPSGAIWRRSLIDESDAVLVADGLGFVTSLTFVGGESATASTQEVVPSGNHLDRNYPNPFHRSTMIRFTLSSSEKVRLRIRDILGKVVAVLADDVLAAGSHDITWVPAGNVPSGVYFYTLESESAAVTKAVTYVK
ncbi:MAG: T9SS type A sorting domain-containing protein, partial [Candidatus Latescibacterota bacterium]